ncbi:AAA family ATPase [Streptomyces coeruleorubidus]|uniref:AAA family ATPase n=1 Tax=Streptomyces coeruleorubidus TaxID=116188 RepID=UPI0037BCF5F0
MDVGAGQAHAPEILGRERELARIAQLVHAEDAGGPKVLVLVGEPGAGKSTLVDRAASQAAARGRRVLRVRGSEGEEDLPFAGVHQLLRPVIAGVERLPPRQHDALRCAFGTNEIDTSRTPDQLLIRLGVLTLLSDAASERPLLIAVDDAQWLDVGSLDVLAFVARRLEGEPAVMLLAARDEAVPGRFDHDFPHLTAGPLERAAAGLLLDAQPHRPKGRVRSQILRQAAGNPLALIELTRAFARDPAGRDIGSVDTPP